MPIAVEGLVAVGLSVDSLLVDVRLVMAVNGRLISGSELVLGTFGLVVLEAGDRRISPCLVPIEVDGRVLVSVRAGRIPIAEEGLGLSALTANLSLVDELLDISISTSKDGFFLCSIDKLE